MRATPKSEPRSTRSSTSSGRTPPARSGYLPVQIVFSSSARSKAGTITRSTQEITTTRCGRSKLLRAACHFLLAHRIIRCAKQLLTGSRSASVFSQARLRAGYLILQRCAIRVASGLAGEKKFSPFPPVAGIW